MFTSISWATQQTMIWIAHFVAFVSWALLAILIVRYLIKKDWTRSKITLLYALNSSSFLFAWWMVLSTALIVIAPIADTREHSVDILWSEANRYLFSHAQYGVIALLSLLVFDLLYMRLLVRQSVIRHSIILFAANAVVLFSAVYLSVGTYYTGMLQEIDRHFLGQ